MVSRIYKTIPAFLLLLFIVSCTTVRNTSPSPIGLVSLTGYRYTAQPLTADTTYRIYQRQEDFDRQFSASGEVTRQPGFSGQWVVAILLKETPALPLRFERAELNGSAINVYAQPCTGTECDNNPVILATIPRSGSARHVRFFVNGERKREVALSSAF